MKNPEDFLFGVFLSADDGNRTRDLRLTKATLYRLSHISAVFTPRDILSYS